jgi:hypothetical protein
MIADSEKETQKTSTKEIYEYYIKPTGVETLVNVLVNYGVDLRANYYNPLKDMVIFTSDRLLDMKSLKGRGIVRSYTISKIVINNQVIEQG